MKIVLQKFKTETLTTDEGSQSAVIATTHEYSVPFVPAAAFLEYLEIEAEKENPQLVKVEDAKKIVKLIVKTYENQFTEEEFFKGIPGYKLMDTIDEFIFSLNTDPYADKHQEINEEQEGNAEKKAG